MEEFEKRYDGLTVEKEMQLFWEKNEVYKFDADSPRPVYSIDTPPPTVNGSLHVGHIFSYTQAEMIARYRRMKGFNVFYPFGFDDNGLPSERLVERECGVKAKDLPRSEFCDKCIETTQKYEAEFKELWKSMGFSCDWNLLYSSVSKEVQKLSQLSFLELAKNKHAYIKESPVLWCTECQTSIAQAELESKDIESSFNYLPFTVEEKVIEVATTRPELLYGVVCVLVNPEDNKYKQYVGKNIKVPLYDFEVPILADEKVALDKGTGVVMCATFGDSTDVEWADKYNFEYKKVILADGHIAEDVPYIGGMHVKKARKEIINILREKNLLIKEESITHSVAVHERCGTPVEIIPSKQWYIDVLSKKEELLAAGDKIDWHPAQMKNRYTTWVENLKWDWCISRQRYFGVPFPVWYCAKCSKPYFATEDMLPVNPLETEYKGKCECGCEKFIPEKSVFDTWATSSISPLINQHKAKEVGFKGKFMPMGMRTQAHEIIRTWAFYTIVKSLYHTGEIPWKDTMICGFVLAKPGEKISKSKGNAKLTPNDLIQTYSADAIRYWVASTKLGTDTFFDQSEMQEASKRIMTKLWNSAKFVISHLQDFDVNYKVEKLLPIDTWMIERTNQTVLEASRILDEYEIGLARKVIDDLFWKDLCDNYIEIVKERLYQPQVHGVEERKSAQYAIYYCFLTILKMYAIYIPHITEYIYHKSFKDFDGNISIHKSLWPEVTSVDSKILEFGEQVKSAVFEMRKYKSDNNISIRTEMEEFTINGSKKFAEEFKLTTKDLIACTHAKKIDYELS